MARELHFLTFFFHIAPAHTLKLSVMVELEGLHQAGAKAETWVTRLRRCTPSWRHRSRTDTAESIFSGNMVTMLPDDVLCLILQHVDFQGKCELQLVCK